MANEGEYPKVDGDVLYSSEANRDRNNYAYGITPTISLSGTSTWQVEPSGLSAITDGDLTTWTNVFRINRTSDGGGGYIHGAGYINLDFGSIYLIKSIGAFYSGNVTHSPGLAGSFSIEYSKDNSTWNAAELLGADSFMGIKAAWEDIPLSGCDIRYIRMGQHVGFSNNEIQVAQIIAK